MFQISSSPDSSSTETLSAKPAATPAIAPAGEVLLGKETNKLVDSAATNRLDWLIILKLMQ